MLQPSFYLVFLFCILRLPAATRCDGRDVDGLDTLPADAVALLAFKSKADLDNKLLYTTNERFDYCQWQGVKCAQGRVVRFIAESFGLRGTVSGAALSRLDQLRVLSLRNNSLSGTIPDFSPLVNLKTLVLDHNYFSGTFPLPILSLHHLSILDLSHNNLTGLLPENLLVLDRLGYLRLDSNSFYGPIPPLNQTILQVFSVSYNNLSGPIPVTQLSKAETANAESHEAKKLKFPEQKKVVKSGSLVFCSGEEELYTLDQLMRASAELLGRGTIGITYKAVMSSQLIVSVKRLDACKTAITSGEEFEQHMEAVGVLRHPNLVPVRAYFQAKQERLIIFDYQPNGSLFNLIHDKLKRIQRVINVLRNLAAAIVSEDSRSNRSKPLHWTSCLKIAEDVAQGLAYIHQASKLIHGNLKPSNVLLGPDFEACITDYCLAILELLTGKTPSQHPFLAPPDMPDWVQVMRGDDSDDDIRLRMLVEVAGICRVTSRSRGRQCGRF
ncbi:UNVERIFIED_CONTAM: putative inactive receptor kinase [Sesamum calycinum]|uniref:Inactive receptor kinase n=1 Tax=Sesamum calycinum TaxID=2727403 RepID=A0AAW2JCI0_9LAMI